MTDEAATDQVEEEAKPLTDEFTDDELEDLDKAMFAEPPAIDDATDVEESRPVGSDADERWLASLSDEEFAEEFKRRQESNRETINAELAALGRTPLAEPEDDEDDTTGLQPSEHALAYGPEQTDAEIEAGLAEHDKAQAELDRRMRIARQKEHIASLRAKAEAKLRPAAEDLTPAEAERALYADTAFAKMSDSEFRDFLKARDAGKAGTSEGIGRDALDQTYRRLAPVKKVGER